MSKHRKNNKNKELYGLLPLCVALVVALLILVFDSKPDVKEGAILASDAIVFSDTTLVEDRQFGLVDLDKFTEMLSKLGPSHFNESCMTFDGDSVSIRTLSNVRSIFYKEYSNSGDIEKMAAQCSNFPVTLLPNCTGFTAEIVTIGERRFIRIPYLILASVADWVLPPDASSQDNNISGNTPSDPPIETQVRKMPDDKVQTEGLVRKNFFDILANHNKKRTSDPYAQLAIAWEFVKDNWQYVYDPLGETDTWRSAYETIQEYYNNGKIYAGDCDDFAILMASFAKQVGMYSQCVCVKGDEGWHMYARFRKDSVDKWHYMDWFSKKFDDTPYQGTIYIYYE